MTRPAVIGVALISSVILFLGCVSGGHPDSGEYAESVGRYGDIPLSASKDGTEHPDLDEDATLDDYVLYAIRNNPGSEAAFNKWLAARQRVPQAGAYPDPRLNFSYYIEEVETRVGPQRWSTGLSQTFPWFDKLDLRSEVAVQAASAVEQEFRASVLSLCRDVRTAYFEYYYTGRAIAITKENISLMADLESVARVQYKVASTPYSSIVKAQVELGILDDRLQTLRDLLGSAAARLNALLNRPPDASLPIPQSGAVEEWDLPFSDKELYFRLGKNNPDLKVLDSVVARDKAAIDLAKKGYYPDMTLGVNYINTSGAAMGGVSDSGKDPVIASLSLNLPFLSGKYAAAEKEAERRHRAAIQERRERKNRLDADLRTFLFQFRDGKRKIDLYRDTLLPKANQSLQATRQAFEAGEADFLELIDAERVLLEFQLAFERALADHGRGLAEIERLLGGFPESRGDAAEIKDRPRTVPE